MKRLLIMDVKDYEETWERHIRPSVRAIIERDGKLAMVHNLKYDYYMFPGGGIEKGERYPQALAREVKEETGLIVIPETIEEYGSILRIQKSLIFENIIFEQENYYYKCRTKEKVEEQELDEHEKEEEYRLEFIAPEEALKANMIREHGEKKNGIWIERASKILEMLIEEKKLY